MEPSIPFSPGIDAGRSAGRPDTSVVARARAGDRDAFALLHKQYSGLAHAVVLAHARPDDAADLTQEVFARALAHIHRLREHEAVGAWLAGIARNVACDNGRRRRNVAAFPDEFCAPAAPNGAVDDARDVLDALQALPDTYRETLAMRLVEQMTGPEIATRTGLTPGSVRVHLHRGMKLLHEELQKRGLLR